MNHVVVTASTDDRRTVRWQPVARLEQIPIGGGRACLIGEVQIALLRPDEDRIFAIDNHCSHWGEAVLARGLLRGGDDPAVACPLHKRLFSLSSGECLDGDCGAVRTWPVRVEHGQVLVQI